MKINPEIVNRLMNALGYKTKRQLASKLGISAPDLNNRIKSGSIKQLLIDLAIHNNVNIDWLLTGKGSMTSQAPESSQGIAESQPDYGVNKEVGAVREPPLQNEQTAGKPTGVDLLLKIIEEQNKRIEEQGKRIDEQGQRITEQGKRIDVAINITEKTSFEQKAMWDRINSMQEVLDAYHVKMKRAAESGDLKALGE